MIWRRKHLPASLEGPYEIFMRVLAQIEPAKAALTHVMPTTRMPGTPLPDALAEFEERVDAARSMMPAWRHPEIEEVWAPCDAGIDEALDRAKRLREEAPELGGFEGLIWAVEQLLAPLEPFSDAAARFRRLRAAAR
jgi:hypothetical protein